ncbi:LutB/LldF family L-lactate oxidation iron-sulfur protein [Agarivorans sp. MS3-6]|uniref:LutB/LldF family L-lactate oxidation iron-sulfur protein n=1 Tax=Agarivorans sp. TSD2052 TaxID=2937286 RepID=UPI00200D9A07|nr:LutB/LldF family L-lactate oxidation iron-sulfur protein [Agarivorans sp. TSD2052]UPW17544.1 LutB/LldF family L-lactate oxidation iron-sulfur protein [Agarivorans sp. TSD2052]
MSVQHYQAKQFKSQAREALADQQLRDNFRGAMDYLQQKRKDAFNDPDELAQLRLHAENIRQRCLAKLPELLEQLERHCEANGIKVHWAEDAAQAQQLIAGLIQQAGGQKVVKGKSMVTEEIALNQHLESLGIECVESDMGEYIVQLAEETPSHIIMPAIHKNKQQVADIFQQHIKDFNYTLSVDKLIQTGREVLRSKFQQADVGISGVNFAVAETGTLCLVENEGNGRMTTTVPPLHIAVTGIEKVVEFLSDVPPLFSILTRSATGQHITTYFNMISGPRRAPERDGPQQVHLVLLDNGRSQAYADEALRKTLQCIRCGACMNHCPVYTRVGGHAYGTTYPGPIGKIISPHLQGLANTSDLVTASSLCGACEEVCPVNIPIPSLLQRLRRDAKLPTEAGQPSLKGQASAASVVEHTAWRAWAWLSTHSAIYNVCTSLVLSLAKFIPIPMGAWTRCRGKPALAEQSFHQAMKQRQQQANKQPISQSADQSSASNKGSN